ncbi:MAG: hypothetical protein ACD_71C00239G0002 [uncultured bacterium (gcode 4)]|uniref:Uncharacterized protein n=1 Tax=uncultured bacterium (gcode 4) TaxID=1234023 RepID=K1Z4B4_9BACT|nr:MAG: hypothetical protein ACD_71C00239G0002 [uncultured bacterium (gcode 4)]
MLENTFYLTWEDKISPIKIVIEWFLSKSIPGAKECIFLFIEDTKSPHSIEMVYAISSPFLVTGKHHFRIWMRRESVSLFKEFFFDFLVVIYLSVENNRQVFAFMFYKSIVTCSKSLIVEHWLVSGRGEVDNGKSHLSESKCFFSYGFHKNPLIIGSAMFDGSIHTIQKPFRFFQRYIGFYKTVYPTHETILLDMI